MKAEMRRSWITTEVRTLLEQYGTRSLGSISTELNRSQFSVAQKARRLFLCNRHARQHAVNIRAENSLSVNARFFDKLDGKTAYVLGFAYSCGSLKKHNRMVLKFRVDNDRRAKLIEVLAIMQSRHVIQPTGRFLVVEICNSHLVSSLISIVGNLPSRTEPDPPMPNIPNEWMKEFVRGHAAGTGLTNSNIVRWSGSQSVVDSVTEFLTGRLPISNPTMNKFGSKLHMAWKRSSDVLVIRAFLGI